MNFLDSRLKFHATSLLVALFLTLSIVLNRYGSGTLEDNLVAKLYTSYDSEAQFLAFYTVLNCYGIFVTSLFDSPRQLKPIFQQSTCWRTCTLLRARRLATTRVIF